MIAGLIAVVSCTLLSALVLSETYDLQWNLDRVRMSNMFWEGMRLLGFPNSSPHWFALLVVTGTGFLLNILTAMVLVFSLISWAIS